MRETSASSAPSGPELQARLQAIAQRVEQSESLDPESRQALAELVGEMSQALETNTLPAAEFAHLDQAITHLEQSLDQQQDSGLLDGLERVVANAEANAPTAVGFTRRLLDVLSNIGI